MILAILGVITVISWLILLTLLATNALPIHKEGFIGCGLNCIGVYPVEIPTIFTKTVAVLPFLGIILIIATLVSRKVVIDTKAKKTKNRSKNGI